MDIPFLDKCKNFFKGLTNKRGKRASREYLAQTLALAQNKLTELNRLNVDFLADASALQGEFIASLREGVNERGVVAQDGVVAVGSSNKRPKASERE
jgi:hypothetical protein